MKCMLNIDEVQKNPSLINEFIEQNVALVKMTISKYFRNAIGTQEFEEYMQSGIIGLMKAVKGFNPSFDVKFSTYAVPMIMGEIQRYRRDYEGNIIKLSRGKKEAYYKYTTLKNSGMQDDEICHRIGISQRQLDKIRAYMPQIQSMNEVIYEGKDGSSVSLEDHIADSYNLEDEVTYNLDVQRAIQSMKNILPPLDYGIFKLLMKEKSQQQIADTLKISQAHVSRKIRVIRDKFKLVLDGTYSGQLSQKRVNKERGYEDMQIDKEKVKKLLAEGKSIEEVARLINAPLATLKGNAVRWGFIPNKQIAVADQPKEEKPSSSKISPNEAIKWREEKPKSFIRPTAWVGNGREYSFFGNKLIMAGQGNFSVDKNDIELFLRELQEVSKVIASYDESAAV